MKISSFNINGIKARLPELRYWLSKENPDIVGLQELKSDSSGFTENMFADLGYHGVFNGQKGYNGCGILSKQKILNPSFILPGMENDTQSRWLSADINDLMICNLYLPNGNPVGTDKLDYKLEWMSQLISHARYLIGIGKPVIMFGDFNVIPQDIDCLEPNKWVNDALFHPQVRSKFFEITNLGFYDALRLVAKDSQVFTQWDYQGGSWQKNNGVRIDHFLLTPSAMDLLVSCGVDKYMRSRDRPSDHVPVWIELSNRPKI